MASMERPPDTLTCDRVALRRLRARDVDALRRAIDESLDHLLPWMPWAAEHSRPRTEEYLARCEREWVSGEAFGYAITSGDAVVGGCGLMRRVGPGGLEIGYWVHAAWTGRGLATMAAGALTREGLALSGVDRIEIHHDEANHASGAVPRRLGFTEIERVPAPEGPTAPGELGVNVVWHFPGRPHRPAASRPATGRPRSVTEAAPGRRAVAPSRTMDSDIHPIRVYSD